MKKLNQSSQPKWKALKGKRFSRRNSSGAVQTKPAEIAVLERAKSVVIPPDNDDTAPYGVPIDAKLAINLIHDFHAMLSEPVLGSFLDGGEVEFDFSEKDSRDQIVEAFQKLVEILKRSCAITIDKNVILKTLSQPGCEGLRFYLCKKSNAGENFISLVTVGVNAQGEDLLYEYSSGSTRSASTSLRNMSLISEYGHPPGGSTMKGNSIDELYAHEAYVLLRYALDMTRAARKTRTRAKRRRKKS